MRMCVFMWVLHTWRYTTTHMHTDDILLSTCVSVVLTSQIWVCLRAADWAPDVSTYLTPVWYLSDTNVTTHTACCIPSTTHIWRTQHLAWPIWHTELTHTHSICSLSVTRSWHTQVSDFYVTPTQHTSSVLSPIWHTYLSRRCKAGDSLCRWGSASNGISPGMSNIEGIEPVNNNYVDQNCLNVNR